MLHLVLHVASSKRNLCSRTDIHLLRDLGSIDKAGIEAVAELVDAGGDLVKLDVLVPAVPLDHEHLESGLMVHAINNEWAATRRLVDRRRTVR